MKKHTYRALEPEIDRARSGRERAEGNERKRRDRERAERDR